MKKTPVFHWPEWASRTSSSGGARGWFLSGGCTRSGPAWRRHWYSGCRSWSRCPERRPSLRGTRGKIQSAGKLRDAAGSYEAVTVCSDEGVFAVRVLKLQKVSARSDPCVSPTFPALTCGGPVLLGQGVRVEFDPQVVIVTCWVRWGAAGTQGLIARWREEGGKGKPEPEPSVPTTKHPAGGGRADPERFVLCECDSGKLVGVFQLKENVTTAFDSRQHLKVNSKMSTSI